MEGIRAWLQDRKNLPIVAGGAALVVIVAALFFLKMTGTIGGQAQPDATAYQPPTTTPPPIGTPEAMVTPGTPQPGIPGAPGTVPPAGPPEVAAAVPAAEAQPPMLPYRKDPFMPFGGPPRRASVLMHLLPTVSRPRVTTYTVKHEKEEWELPEEVLPPQPFRRMTGVMWNGHVSAILETAGEYDIVRPGMEIRRANTRVMVESIQPTSITLKTLDTWTPMTINVNMAGSVAAAGAVAPTGPTPGAYPTPYPGPMPGPGPTPGVINP